MDRHFCLLPRRMKRTDYFDNDTNICLCQFISALFFIGKGRRETRRPWLQDRSEFCIPVRCSMRPAVWYMTHQSGWMMRGTSNVPNFLTRSCGTNNQSKAARKMRHILCLLLPKELGREHCIRAQIGCKLWTRKAARKNPRGRLRYLARRPANSSTSRHGARSRPCRTA